ncbi:restriction endonuclease subunit S [Egbenema bharatensis]|uniref:restriction endonuclease subunit S n=1 Tax=Egbenema bharatensis TaxID=3463334 RepID=UPI003A8A759D
MQRPKSQYWNGNIPWLKTGEINYSEITTAEECITEQGLRNSAAKLAPPGTILMAMYGQGVTRGRVAILGIEAAFNQACLAIMPFERLQTKYLYYYLRSAYSFVRDFGNETSQMNLSSGLISKIKILVPSDTEQKEVSDFLDRKLIDFDLSISKQEQIIESLHLLKQTFVANAVTGKIKV